MQEQNGCIYAWVAGHMNVLLGKRRACENCVVGRPRVPSPTTPPWRPALRDQGLRLRSSRFLRFGNAAPQGTGRGRRCHAAGCSAGDRPPLRRAWRAALVTRPGLPQFGGGGPFSLTDRAAGVARGHGREYSASQARPSLPFPSLPPQHPLPPAPSLYAKESDSQFGKGN